MWRSNLMLALHIAIEEREKYEKSLGFTGDSAFTAGLRESLQELKQGNLTIKYDDLD